MANLGWVCKEHLAWYGLRIAVRFISSILENLFWRLNLSWLSSQLQPKETKNNVRFWLTDTVVKQSEINQISCKWSMRTNICIKKKESCHVWLVGCATPYLCECELCDCSSLQWNVCACWTQLILGASYCKEVPVLSHTFLSSVRTVVTIFCVICLFLMPSNKVPLERLLLEM